MPLTKVRRPKFERQDIRQNLFTSYLSCQRLDKIQRLMKLKNVDGILCIIGIDGKFNPGSLELFNYLFFDIFLTRRDDIDRSKLDDDVFDDVMICIRTNEIHVYCNGANYWLMLPYMAFWPGFRLHCLSETEMEDPEKLEKFKMESFAEMTRSCETIAVVTKGNSELCDETSFDPMTIEKWPIVQSYAFDDFGRFSEDKSKKGFFTLVHKVTDLSKEIHEICQEMDPIHLENIYKKVLSQMEGLFENIFQILDSKCSNDSFEINEEIIEEPVISYYKHLKTNKYASFNGKPIFPVVLSGHNTRQSILLNKMENITGLKDSKQEKIVKNPYHMVIQCVNLQTGVVIGRTVFLQDCTNLDKPNAKSESACSNVMTLSLAYNAIISTMNLTIRDMNSSKDIIPDAKKAEQRLKEFLNQTKYLSCSFKIIKIGSTDDGHGFLLVFQGVVFDVINEVYGENLGSVLFADTFVVLKTPLNRGENMNAALFLGRRIDLFSYWNKNNLSKLQQIMSHVHHMEPVATEVIDVVLTDRPFQEVIIQQLSCTFYSDRILLFNRRFGTSILFPEAVVIFEGESYGDWTIVSINCSTSKLKYFNQLWNQCNGKDVLHLIFPNHSKLRKTLINWIIPKWKETILNITSAKQISCPYLEVTWSFLKHWMLIHGASETPNTTTQSIIDGISEDLHQSLLIKAYLSSRFSLLHRQSCIKVFSNLMVLSYSMRFYENNNSINGLEGLTHNHSKIFASLIQQIRPHPIINQNCIIDKKLGDNPQYYETSDDHDEHNENKSTIVVTVLCGVPGGGAEFVAKKITKIVHDDLNWILVLPRSIEDVGPLTEKMLQSVIDSRDKLGGDDHTFRSNGTVENFRILLLAPPFCFPSEIVHALNQVNSEMPLVIGSISVCLNPDAVYLDNKDYTLPGVLDMCNEGWVNNIILTGSDLSSIKTSNLSRILKARNDLCTIYLTPRADVNKELDTVLSKVAFEQKRFDFARVLYPSPLNQTQFKIKNVKKVFNRLYEISYNLCGALLKENIIKTVRDIFKSLKSAPYEKNIYFIDGVVSIEEDPRSLYTLTAVSLTKQLLIYPLTKRSNCIDNCEIEEIEKSFLRIFVTTEDINPNDIEKVTNLRNHFLTILSKFQRQKPSKKKKLDKSDLSKKQIDEIHAKRHLETLPEGWFYNGVTYVHMDGRRSDKHPALEDFINAFLEEENHQIEISNSVFDKITLKNAFVQ